MTQSVLIVDADQSFTDSAQAALEERGVVVHVRDDAPLDLIKKLRPTVMMLNIELPKGATTGLSICSRIRRDRELRETPILLTTTGASADMLKKHAQSADKADDYARKPIGLEEVLARLGRLLQTAPAQTNGEVSHETRTDDVEAFDDDFEEERPSQPTVTASPAPLNAPPPLKREIAIASTTSADELWRPTRIEDVLRSGLDMPEPQSPAKATPEERLAYLRQLVKYYETRDKLFREVWQSSQTVGQDLAKRAVSMAIELERRDRRIEEIGLERDNKERRLLSVETEFKAFQDEITRIFREKDAEEQATYARITQLEADHTRLTRELEGANTANKDHERRLQIFQDEVEGLQVEKDDAEAKVIELSSGLEDAGSNIESLRARLELTEGVATERAEEIEKLREQVDRIALDSGQERERLITGHDEARAEKEAEYKVAIETLEHDQRSEIASLIKRHEDLLQTFTRTQESEVEALETERAQLNQRIEDLLRGTRELEERLRHDGSSHAAEIGKLRADIDDLERGKLDLETDLSTTTSLHKSLTIERDALTKDLAKTRADLGTALRRVEEQDNSLDELEATLEKEKKQLSERVAELEEELDGAQNESFERLAELERLRKTQDKVAGRTQNLETSLKISEKALGVAETRGRALESENAVMKARDDELSRQNAELEAQHKRLEAVHQENLSMLERERERFSRAEDLLIKAKDRIGELQREVEETSARIFELEEAAGKKEAELSEAYSAVSDTERRAEEMGRAHGDELGKLRPELEGAKKRIGELHRDLGALEATEQALLKEIDMRDEKIASVEAELAVTKTHTSGVERELENERVRALGFAQLSSQREELMRRMVTALGAGLDVLNRPKTSTDDLFREMLSEVSSSLAGLPLRLHSPPQAAAPQAAAPAPPSPAPPEPARPQSVVQSPPAKPLPQFPPPSAPKAAKGGKVKSGPPPLPTKSAPAAKKPQGFDESFADEATTTDSPQVRRFESVDGKPPRGTKKNPVFEAEEEELENLANLLTETSDEDLERHVTEVVRIDKLK